MAKKPTDDEWEDVTPAAAPAAAPASGFDTWYATQAKKRRLDPNPDAPEHHYDYRALYNDVQASGGKLSGDHFPSKYKKDTHPRAYLADSKGRVFDTRTGLYTDGTRVPQREMDRAEHAPDLPEAMRPKPTQAAPPAADEWEDVTTPTPTPAPAPPVSTSRALARGVRDGASLEWADEAKGAWAALFGKGGTWKERYAEARDADRAETAQIREEKPVAYGVGNFGGTVATSFAPGLRAGKGATAGQRVVQAGKTAAVAGAGASEAETTEGVLVDAGVSGLLGAGTAGVLDRVVRGAPERSVRRAIGDITDGATATQRDKVVGKAGSRVASVVRELDAAPEIRKAGDSAGKLAATETAMRNVGTRLDDAYARASSTTPGVKVSDVLGRIASIADRLGADPGKRDLARAVAGKADDVLETWGNQTHVPASAVRELASDIADTAFRGSPAVAPKAGQAVSQEVWRELKDLIADNIDEAAKKAGGGGAKELTDLNQRMSTLLNMREALRYRATREATESTRLKDRISGGVDIGLALAEPTAFVAKKAYDFVGKPLLRKGDDMLATLVTAAENGSTAAQIAERAITLGASPVVANALGSWAVRTARELEGQE